MTESRPLLNIGITAAVFATSLLLGYLSHLLGQPPLPAAPVWLPAGVAVAAVLCGGRRQLFGVAAGAFACDWLARDTAGAGPDGLGAAGGAVSAAGAVLQSLAAGWLLGRMCGPDFRLVRWPEVIRFLLVVGFLAPCVRPSFTVIRDLGLGRLPLDKGFGEWLFRWTAESLGACLVTPVALAVFARPREVWGPRRIRIALPVVGAVSVACLLFAELQRQERVRIGSELCETAEAYADAVDTASRDGRRCVVALHGMIRDGMPPAELGMRADGLVKTFEAVRSVGHHPLVTREDRAGYEDRGVVITRMTAEGRLERQRERDWLAPIDLWVERGGTGPPKGLDLGASLKSRRVIESVIGRNRTLAISGREAELPGVRPDDLVVFYPVYMRGTTPISLPDRRKAAVGLVTCVYDTEVILKNAKASSARFAAYQVLVVVSDSVVRQQPERQASVTWDADGAIVQVPAYVEEKPLELTIRVDRSDPLLVPTAYLYSVLVLVLITVVLFAAVLLASTGETVASSAEVVRKSDMLSGEVVARQHAQDALRESETRLRLAMSAARLGVWEWDLRTDELICPLECSAIYGLDRPICTREQFTRLLHPEDLDAASAAFREAVDRRELLAVEFRILRPDGQVRWVSNFAKAEYAADGTPTKMVGTVADVTDRRRTADALRESEGWLRLALRSADLGLWDWDLRTNTAKFSPEWKRQIGYEDGELTAGYTDWESRVHPDDLPAALDTVRRAVMEGDRYDAEFRLRHKDGSWRWFLARADVLRSADGTAERLVGCHLDVTARKESELALAASERFARETLDALPYNTCVLDEHGVIVQVNAGWTAFAVANGGDPSLMSEGVNYLDACRAVSVNSTSGVVASLEALLAGRRREYVHEYPCFSPSVERWFRLRANRFHVGSRVRVLIQHEDVTDRRRAQDEIARLNAQLERRVTERTRELQIAQEVLRRESDERRSLEGRLAEAVRLESMSVMAGSIAHELNQPLTAIANFARGCVRRLEAGEAGDEVRAVMSRTAEEALRAGTLIRRLRDMTTRRPQEFAPASVTEVVTQALFILDPILQASGVRVDHRQMGDVPAVPIDRLLVTQVVLNLLQNAIDSMAEVEREAREVVIDAAVTPDGTAVQVGVHDRGHGLSDSYSDQWFVPFSSKKPGGMGIGLQVVKNIVELHGGKVSAAPRHGGGATFTFTLPLVQTSHDLDSPDRLRGG
jgi:PAS domain S-box-containing protein